MARRKSELLSAWGTAFEIWKRIVDAVLSLGGSDEDLRRLLKDDELVAYSARAIMGAHSKAGRFVLILTGRGDDNKLIFSEGIGPYNYIVIREWLDKNGFEPIGGGDLVTWLKTGETVLCDGDKRHRCDTVWAEVSLLRNPDELRVSQEKD